MERLLDQLMAEDDDGAWRRCRARAGGIHPPGHRDVLTVRRAFGAVGVRIDDGEFTVVNHAGDNVLGGKQRQAAASSGKPVDWARADDVLTPAAHEADSARASAWGKSRTEWGRAWLLRLNR